MNTRKAILYSLIALAVLAGVATLAYSVGYNRSRKELASMQEEMLRLEEAGKEAAIVKRVSQQMEDIAYQQKAISDQQRDRAEQQSILANRNARIAEQESRAAHQAELKANAAAQVAQRERANAELQQEIAVEQRDEATHAKNVADTLNRRTQARSLAVSSLVRREAGDTELADLLAYASWYLLKHNRGNQFFSDTFKALTQATGGIARYRMRENGSVTAMAKVLDSPEQCVALTNYGEVELLSTSVENGIRRIVPKQLFFNPEYDFRDAKYLNGKIYAVSLKGPLCILDTKGKCVEVSLPEDNYFKVLRAGGRILLVGRRSLCWYADGKVSGHTRLPRNLSAVAEREGTVCLFYADGSYAEMDASGKVEEKTPLIHEVVTYVYYSKPMHCLLLGTKDGAVYPVNKYNRVMEVLAAHKSTCVDITMQGSNVVTGSYDKNVYIWNLDNLMFESGLTFREELEVAQVGARKPVSSREIPAEWLVPVDYTFDGWTLSVCGDMDGKSVWVGTSTGNIMLLNSSADDMAAKLQARLKRNMTQQEWARYVGVSIPYMTFK